MYKRQDVDPDLMLGRAELLLPPHMPVGSPLQITLTLDRQGRLHVLGKDLTSGTEVHSDMQIKGALSESQIEELTAKTGALKIRDF